MMYKLHKTLYGLKQAPRAWNLKIDCFFKLQEFRKCEMEYGVYIQHTSDSNMIRVCLYVDVILLTWSYSYEIAKFKKMLMNEFELTNCKSAITLAETNHKLDFDVEDDDVDAITFKQLIDSLRYLYNTRPDIFYSVGIMSRLMNKPKWSHYQAAIRILRYIKRTLKYGVLFPSGVKYVLELIGYSDSEWCGDKVDIRCTSGYFFKYLGCPISWCSKKQPVVALSTCEPEYIASVLSVCQVVWILNLLQDLKIKVSKHVKLMIDNKSYISLDKNLVLHGRSKYIDIKFHFMKNQVKSKVFEIVYYSIQK